MYSANCREKRILNCVVSYKQKRMHMFTSRDVGKETDLLSSYVGYVLGNLIIGLKRINNKGQYVFSGEPIRLKEL